MTLTENRDCQNKKENTRLHYVLSTETASNKKKIIKNEQIKKLYTIKFSSKESLNDYIYIRQIDLEKKEHCQE